jgi:hypothetical protein
MMTNLVKRGEQIASGQQRRTVQAVAQRLRAIFGSAAVEIEEARVVVRGRGLVKRWLVDPSLRFVSGGLK